MIYEPHRPRKLWAPPLGKGRMGGVLFANQIGLLYLPLDDWEENCSHTENYCFVGLKLCHSPPLPR